MTKTQARNLFLGCIGRLLAYAHAEGIRLIATDFDRSDEEQARLRARGASKVARSQHQDWLAMDLVELDESWQPIWTPTMANHYDELGAFWKTLHPLCRWGGDFGSPPPGQLGWDAGHFEVSRDYKTYEP